jgi:hypothetical protein
MAVAAAAAVGALLVAFADRLRPVLYWLDDAWRTLRLACGNADAWLWGLGVGLVALVGVAGYLLLRSARG